MNKIIPLLKYDSCFNAMKELRDRLECKVMDDLLSYAHVEPMSIAKITRVVTLTLLHPNGYAYDVALQRPAGESLMDLIEYLTIKEGSEDTTREEWIREIYTDETHFRGADKVGRHAGKIITMCAFSIVNYWEGDQIRPISRRIGFNEYLVPSADDIVQAILVNLGKRVFGAANVHLGIRAGLSDVRTEHKEPHYEFELHSVAGYDETSPEMLRRKVLVPVKREVDNGDIFAVTFYLKAGSFKEENIQTSMFYASPHYTQYSAATAADHIFEYLTEGSIAGDMFK